MSDVDSRARPGVRQLFPATPAQYDAWAAAQLGGDAALAGNDAVLLHLHGPLGAARLAEAIAALVARHQCLRAAFSSDGRTLRLAAAAPPPITWLDVSARGDDEQLDAMATLRRSAVEEPFDLERGPLVRFTVMTRSGQRHALVVAAHQAICDAASFVVLLEELSSLYDGSVADGDRDSNDATQEEAANFGAYADTLWTDTAQAKREQDEQFWTAQYATRPRQLDLPTDRARGPHPSHRSAREDYILADDLTTAVGAWSRSSGRSVTTTLLGGFAVLLSRLSGQDDLVIGTMVAGDAAAEQATNGHRLVGQRSSLLPLRLPVPSDLAFDAFLAQLTLSLADASAHQPVGFGSILSRLRERWRDGSNDVSAEAARLPLVTAVFNVMPSENGIRFGALRSTLERVPRAAELFDLVVNAVVRDTQIVLECQHNSEIYAAQTVRRWLASLEQLLRAAIADPTVPVGQLRIRTDEDDSVLERCNATTRTIPSELLIHELVEAETERAPDRVAVEQDAIILRYDELNARANQLAHYLRGLGVHRGELVGLLLDRTPDTIVSLLAVLKAGAGYVPLDPALPLERLERMATDAGLAAVITTARIRDDINISARETVCIDSDAGVIALSPPTNLPRDEQTARPHDPAYVIFTSGSTGRPKGVLVPQIGLLNLALSLRHTPGMHRDDVVLAITTLVFDVAVSEVLMPLTLGARIVLASRDTAADGAQLRRLVEARGVTLICSAPASYHLLLEAGWTGHAGLTIICTGEAMPRELAATLVHCGRALWNAYGPSETTVWSTFHRIEAPVQRILIGRPIDNTCVAVRDAYGEQVPIGVVGELFIGGAGVATGYLNLGDATADRFRDDPDQVGLRWYRTGDLVRLLASGDVECLGRADDQVKVRGYRIEPGEIAVVVSQWPGVRQAVVVAREDRVNDVRLVVYVMADAGTRFDDAFRAHVKRILPQYMVPSAVVEMDAFPLTASGKVDKKRLPAPPPVNAAHEFVAPTTATERMLVVVWEEALGGRVGVRDDFFALGGHSLLASQILSRLRRDHGVTLSFRQIFEAPTVELLARTIDQDHLSGAGAAPKTTNAATASARRIVPRLNAPTSPLTAQQQRLCLLEELEPRRRRANSHPASWLLTGPLDETALRTALQALSDRHPMLRTSFHWDDGHRTQRTGDHVRVVLDRIDLSAIPMDAQAAALDAHFVALHETPFDISVAPLFRATLFVLGPDRHRLYTLQHGLIWDGWSFDLFVRDLGALYMAAAGGGTATLPSLSVTFGDFAAWQQQWLVSPEALAQQRWWDAHLAGAREAVSLPTDRPRPTVSSYAGAYVSTTFSADEVRALQHLARRYDGTLYMVLLAAYSALLQRYTGQRDLLVASPMRARTQAELEDVLGPFVNAVVLRLQVEAAATFGDLVRRVRDTALDTYAHQELPFEQLGGQVPAIRTVFSLQDARERPESFGTVAVELAPVSLRYAANDVTLWMQQYPQHMSAVLNYSTELFDEASALLFLEHLRALLRAVVAAPDRPLDELELREQEGTVSVEVPVADQIAPQSALSAIARCAVEYAAVIAVQAGSASETFGTLWSRAGRIAAALRGRGIGSGAVVAMSVPASIDRVVATLGVLRTGADLLCMSPDDGAEYQASIVAATAPQLRIGERSEAATPHSAAAVTLAVLASEGDEGGPCVFGASNEVLAWPAADGTVRVARLPAARHDQQALAIGNALRLAPGVGVCFAVPVAAPARTTSLLAALASGARLLLMNDAAVDDVNELSDDVAATSCTRLIATAESWRTTLDEGWSPAPFECGLLVGSGLSEAELSGIAARGTALHAACGGVHDATVSALHTVRSDAPNWFVGDPVGDGAFRIVDTIGRPTPTGMPGWVESKRAAVDGDWMPTGLYGRATAHAGIQLLSGTDRLCWRDGVPISAVTLDRAIRRVPGVADAAVQMHVDKRGRPWLVGHVVADAGWDIGGLRAQCRTRLPAAWLPNRFVPAQMIVRTLDGVIDRTRLSSPFDAEASAMAQPRTNEERLVADVWRDVLGIEHVGREDNFFARGGTSLLCFRAIDVIRQRTSVRLSPRLLLTGTLAQAARQLATPPSAAPE